MRIKSNEKKFVLAILNENFCKKMLMVIENISISHHHHQGIASRPFWLGRLAFVPDGRSKSRAASAGQPSGGRAAFQTPMHPLYSTRPHGLVQAIFWHTCLDLDLGP